jgi:hypothetical protein
MKESWASDQQIKLDGIKLNLLILEFNALTSRRKRRQIEGASRLCNLPLIPQPLLPKKGEGETDSKSLSRLGRGI